MSDKEYAIRQFALLKARIQKAAAKAKRNPNEITLVGAAKQQTAETVQSFIDAGLHDIGQNYLQEAIEVQQCLQPNQVNWHYIGQIQSNKTSSIANHFDWVHSIDRLKIARRLSAQRNADTPLNLLLQLDIDDEPSKGGVAMHAVADLVAQVSQLEHVSLCGFMVLPRARQDPTEQRQPFAKARELLALCNQKHGLHMQTLSMGMSADLEAAIMEGSTMVRIGTDLFGARSTPPTGDALNQAAT